MRIAVFSKTSRRPGPTGGRRFSRAGKALVFGGLTLAPAVAPTVASGAVEPEPVASLVYSTREWDGDYFSRDRPGGVKTTAVRSGLRMIAGDGSGDQALVAPGERGEFPAASPDGQWIYFQAQTEGHWRICRVRPDGTGGMSVAPAAGSVDGRLDAYGAALARDGRQLTYTLHDGSAGRVVLANADGSGAHGLAPDFGYAYMASPDASAERVVFSGPAQGYRLAIVDTAKGAPRILTPELPGCYVPQFTPDGRAIVFIRRNGGLYRIAPDGGELQQIAEGIQVEFFLSAQDQHGSTDFPAIAPDGRRVAFVARDSGGVPNLFTVGLDGSNRRQVTRLPGACARVQWSPDGRWLALVSLVGDRPQLFVVPADGSAPPRQRTDSRRAVYALSWLPTPR